MGLLIRRRSKMGVELLSFKQTQTMGGRTMKALVKDKPEVGYKLQEMPVPEIGRDEVLFRVEKVAICGSDIALHLWNEVAKVIATVPFIPELPSKTISTVKTAIAAREVEVIFVPA